VRLKKVAWLIEKYHNSGAFSSTLRHIIARYDYKPHKLFLALAEHFDGNDLFGRGLSRKALYEQLYDFIWSHKMECFETLDYDYMKSVSLQLPTYMTNCVERSGKEETFDFIKNNRPIFDSYPSLGGLSTKEIHKRIALVRFTRLFDGDRVLFVDEMEENSVVPQRKHQVLAGSYTF
jgi:hypothetical protein